MTLPLPAIKETGHLGPAMTALSCRHRVFVAAFMNGRQGSGAAVAAAKAAGYGNRDGSSTPAAMAVIASRIKARDDVIAAIGELAKKQIRQLAPLAVEAVRDIVSTIGDPHRLKAANVILERIDPQVSKHEVAHTVEIVDPLTKDLQSLATVRKLGASREKLEELFGWQGLYRLEQEEKRRSVASGTVIEGEFTEVLSPTWGLEDL